jgi:hypothetical protein
VLVIIDLCHTGDVTDEIPATLQRDLPEDWFALFTAGRLLRGAEITHQ